MTKNDMEEPKKKNIVFIANGNSYVESSLRSHLRNNPELNITSLKMSASCLNDLEEAPNAILLFAPDDQTLSESFLENLQNYLVEHDLTLFSLGEIFNLNRLKSELNQCEHEQFSRPYMISDIANRITAYANKHTKTILVVDDSGVMLRKMKGWLEPRYKTILANSGMSAIKCLSLNRPDLILLDYEMPVCDGKQIFEMIRSESEFDEIPIFFLTNRNDKETVCSVMDLKPENYLLKTMEKEDVLKAIGDFFKKQRAKEKG